MVVGIILNQMDLQKKCKFAAWCCNALIIEKKINENIVPITYHTCKNQIAASSSTRFSKYNIKDDITSAWSKEGINIQASE